MKKDDVTIILIISALMFFAFSFSGWVTISSIQNNHINDLMNYCETITGQKQASFNNQGRFIGCESIIR